MAQDTYQQIDLIADIELTWPFSFAGTIEVLDLNDINPNQNGWTIAMPDATLGVVGQNFKFNNISGFSFQIIANDLITVIATVTPGQVIEMWLRDTSTSNGTWRIISPPSVNAITQITAQSTDSTISITNGTVTPPTGTINFKLPTSLANLLNVSTTDLLVVKSTNPLAFRTVSLIGGTNITVNDGNGLSGNPIFDLATTITGISSITSGALVLTGTALIVNSDTNGNLQINTNGTGKIQMNGVSIDANGNMTGINNFVSPRAFCFFTDTIVGVNNVIVIGNQINVATVTLLSGSTGTYRITFTTAMPNANYGVQITLGSNGGVLPFVSNGYFIVRTTTYVDIEIVDASGSLVLSAPYGVSVVIMSN
jgi:hypothetical protein